MSEKVNVGQRPYTKGVLSLYDFLVLHCSCRLIWKCPLQRILTQYNKLASDNHLDVGVGTGYMLHHCKWPSDHPRIALLDFNQNALAHAARRIKRYTPETYYRNVLEPIALDAPKFDSLGFNFVLHCLPGPIETKTAALDNLLPLLNPNGVFFGSTLLGLGVSRSAVARGVMRAYNRSGIFSNESDTLDGLTSALTKRFRDVKIEVVGCAAIFSGRAT